MIAAANLNHGKYQRIDRSPSTETDECLSCEPYVSDRYLTCPLLLSSSLFFPRVWGLDPRYLTCPLIPVRRNSSRLLGVSSALIHFPVGGGMVQIDWRCIALRDLVRRSPRRPAKIAISSRPQSPKYQPPGTCEINPSVRVRTGSKTLKPSLPHVLAWVVWHLLSVFLPKSLPLRCPRTALRSQSPEFPPRSSHIIRQIRSDSPRSITCIGVEASKAGFGVSSHGPICEAGTTSASALKSRHISETFL